MTKNKAALSLASLATLVALPLLVTQAHASTTSDLMKCQFNTKQKVVSCCQRILQDRKRPSWMPGGENPCAQVAKCVGGGGKKFGGETITHVTVPKCLVVIPQDKDKSGGPTPNNGNTKP